MDLKGATETLLGPPKGRKRALFSVVCFSRGTLSQKRNGQRAPIAGGPRLGVLRELGPRHKSRGQAARCVAKSPAASARPKSQASESPSPTESGFPPVRTIRTKRASLETRHTYSTNYIYIYWSLNEYIYIYICIYIVEYSFPVSPHRHSETRRCRPTLQEMQFAAFLLVRVGRPHLLKLRSFTYAISYGIVSPAKKTHSPDLDFGNIWNLHVHGLSVVMAMEKCNTRARKESNLAPQSILHLINCRTS